MNTSTHIQTASAPPGSLHAVVVPIFSDTKNQGEPNGKTKPLTINNTRANHAAAGLSLEGGALTHALSPNGNGVGNSRGFGYDRPDRTPERIAKAQAFHAMIQERRKDKTRCPRCGAPRGEKYRTCDRCREKVRKAKLRAKGIAVVKGGEYSNADLAAMVIQMRREMDKMQQRFKIWQKAAEYRRNLHYRTNTMRKKYLKTVSQAEALDYLAETNHAYESQDAR